MGWQPSGRLLGQTSATKSAGERFFQRVQRRLLGERCRGRDGAVSSFPLRVLEAPSLSGYREG